MPPVLRERFEAGAATIVERVVAVPAAAETRGAAFQDGLPDFDALADALSAVADDLGVLSAPAEAVDEAVAATGPARAMSEAVIRATVQQVRGARRRRS